MNFRSISHRFVNTVQRLNFKYFKYSPGIGTGNVQNFPFCHPAHIYSPPNINKLQNMSSFHVTLLHSGSPFLDGCQALQKYR